MEKLLITPKTKVYELLQAYPDLEDTLMSMAPEFKKLKNPVLRNTIARITSLGQAAIVGGVNVEEMVNRLRQEAGQGDMKDFSETGTAYNTTRPEWFEHKQIVHSINISAIINAGEQPVHEVLSWLKQLKEKEILEIKAPFIPAPLLDKSLSLNYRHWLLKVSEEEYLIYFER
jgi:hypothetical protein